MFCLLIIHSFINLNNGTNEIMVTLIEQLPTELWIQIFSYLEAHDLIQSFSNLNQYFQRLILSNHLPLCLRLGKVDRNPHEYIRKPYWPDHFLQRIVSIRPNSSHQLSHIPEFLRWHSTKLIHLKSLKLKVRGREIPHLSNVLQQLQSLVHLSIECVPNQTLLNGILLIPSLRHCQLEFSRPITPITNVSEHISPVEFLDIQLHDDSHGSILQLLLNHMPQLKKLHMINYDIYVKNREWIFFEPTLILPELCTIRFHCSSNYSSPIIFQSLHINFPTLRRLDLLIHFDFISADLFINILDDWWPLFSIIEHLNLTFKCRRFLTRMIQPLSSEIDQFSARILALNELSNGQAHVEWIERPSIASQLIEISIRKFSS